MEYLTRVLGSHVVYQDASVQSLPGYIDSRYKLQNVTIDGMPCIFVYPKSELEAISTVKKHLERIKTATGIQTVLVPEHLTYRQKEYLLRDHIPFVVEGKQIYLPFMAVYLQERNDGMKIEQDEMLPSAQLLLLHYIYHGCGRQLTSEAATQLKLTATSISRASRQLEELGLINAEKQGVQKIIYSDRTPRELFQFAKGKMSNPVKRQIFVPKAEMEENLLLSGYSALAEFTMLNPPAVTCLAAESIAAWEKQGSDKLQSADDQFCVELWRYNPKKLSKDGCVDPLSLALALDDDRDERVEEAVEGMLSTVWRDIDGQRN